ncbi:MAG: TetR/AcrR family transcriptional regulator [Deltaproteobacteria bacterium]|nr:TetR/AcrR family transcriptional regulator [Deltaproteobacteria bacterium]
MPDGDVRTRTLRIATRLFADRGFDGTSLQDVADEVGVRKPSLLYHFASKDALRAAVYEQMLGHWNVALPRILRAATSGEDRFDAVLGEMIRFFREDSDRAKLILREVLDRPREMAAVMRLHMRPWIESVAAYIRKGQETGELHGDADPAAYVVNVVTFLISAIAVQQLLAPMPDEQVMREVLRMARAALFVPTPAPRARRSSR